MPSTKPKPRSQFTAFLRRHSIKYHTWHNLVDINDFRFHFLSQSERILIICGYNIPYQGSIPFCTPETILIKAFSFHRAIKKIAPEKMFLTGKDLQRL